MKWRIAPLLALIVPILAKVFDNWGNWMDMLNDIQSGYTGFDMNDKQFKPTALVTGLGIIIIACVISWLFAKAGFNRYLPKNWNV